jgi:hypothetical protein
VLLAAEVTAEVAAEEVVVVVEEGSTSSPGPATSEADTKR